MPSMGAMFSVCKVYPFTGRPARNRKVNKRQRAARKANR